MLGEDNLIISDSHIQVFIKKYNTVYLTMNQHEKQFILYALSNFDKNAQCFFVKYPNADKETVRKFLAKMVGFAILIDGNLYFHCGK
jgi:hypothetical protein